MGIDFENIKEKLKIEGYKLTTQRMAILNIIIENKDEHLSSEEIYDFVKVDHSEIGIATVYRTLQLFEKLVIVYRLNFDDGFNRYELNMDSDSHQHHHLICLDCGSITEVKLDLLENLEAGIERETEFKIENHNVKFFGYCKKCQK